MKDRTQEYFSTIEVGKVLGISRIAVFRKVQNGQIPAKKIGRNFAIAREDLEAIMGHKLTESQKAEIKTVVTKAAKEYRDVFERLAKE